MPAYLSPGIVFLKAEKKATDSEEHDHIGKGTNTAGTPSI